MENLQRVYDFLKEAGTYYLATVEGDQPRVRPFGTVNIFEGKLYIQTGKIKPVAHQIIDNPKVEICAFKNGDWIRVCGEMYLDDRIEAKAAMLEQNPDLRAMYSENDGVMEVLYLKDAKAAICSFTAAPEEWEF